MIGDLAILSSQSASNSVSGLTILVSPAALVIGALVLGTFRPSKQTVSAVHMLQLKRHTNTLEIESLGDILLVKEILHDE